MRHRTEIAHVLGFGASWGGFYPLSDSVAETTPVRAPAAHTAPPLRGVRRHCTLARSRIGADVRSCGNGGVMNRSDLTSSVAARTSVPGADADRVVAEVFATIAEALARGEKVPITGFGNFATRSRAVRHGRNPATGESIAIAASTLPSFKAGKTLREVVNARKVLTRLDAVRIAVTGDRYRLYRYPSGNVLPRRAHHRAGRHQHHRFRMRRVMARSYAGYSSQAASVWEPNRRILRERRTAQPRRTTPPPPLR